MAKLLLIDDNLQFCTMLQQMLKSEGHHVVTAHNGMDGIKRFREDPCDLVITDILMPEKEGTETIQELIQEFPDIGIIAISGGGRGLAPEFGLELASAFGAARVLTKPFSRLEIVQAIEDVLGLMK